MESSRRITGWPATPAQSREDRFARANICMNQRQLGRTGGFFRASRMVAFERCSKMVQRGTQVKLNNAGPGQRVRLTAMPPKLRVIVSHPARQANIYYRPRAAEQMGADVLFLTGLYYRPDRFPYWLVDYLPAARKERLRFLLEKRRIDGLSPDHVISLLGPLLEV